MGAHELALVGFAGSGVGTALSVPLMWPRSDRPLDVRLLGSAMLLMSVIAALISARAAGLAPATAQIEHAINLLGLCTFPLLVLYARYAAAARSPFPAPGWWAPAGVYAGLLLTRAALGVDTRVPFAWMLPIILAYTATSVATLWTRGTDRRTTFVPVEWVVAFVVALNVAQVIRMELGHLPPVRAIVPLVMSAGFVAMAAYATWRASQAMAAPRTGAAAQRPARPALDESIATPLLARIDAALMRDRLFARPELTLAHLAAAVEATPHQVSEVLNRSAGISFHELINRRRIDEVKTQLLDPDSARFTIEGIGLSAGFGSRSALYTAFKRLEGQTPAEFRAAHHQER